MKKGLLLYLLFTLPMVSVLLAGDDKNVWVFPPSSHLQRIDEYRGIYDFNEGNIHRFYDRSTGGDEYPFFVADERYLYLLEGHPRLRIDTTSIRTEYDGFQTYYDGAQQVTTILGGGYYASNRIPNKTFVATFKQLREAREYLLTGKLEFVHNDLIDTAFILPQVIKSVKLSDPFLEETIRGIQYTYDADVVLYRWFYLYLSRGNMAMYFINDPTPLVEGAPGSGAGLSLEVEFHIPSDNLVVLNGFVDLDRKHLYRLNARMKRVRVTGAGFEFEYEFEDYVHFAQIDFPAAVTAVKLTVLEVYEGEKYEDLAISGLFVNPDVLKTRNSTLAYEYRDEAEKAYQKQNQQKR